MGALSPSLKRSVKQAITRDRNVNDPHYTTFNDVAQSYITFLDNPIDLSGDTISIEVDFLVSSSFTVVGSLVNLCTSDRSQVIGLEILPNGFVKVYSDGYTPTTGSNVFNDGNWHTVRFEINKVTAFLTVHVDGVFEYSRYHNGPSKLVDSYYVSVGRRLFDSIGGEEDNQLKGRIANLKIYSDDSVVLDAPINQYYTPSRNTVIDYSSNQNHGTFVNVALGDSAQAPKEIPMVDNRPYLLGDSRYFTVFDPVARTTVGFNTPIVIGDVDTSVRLSFMVNSSRPLLSTSDSDNSVDIDTNGGSVRAFARVGGVLQPVLTSVTNTLYDGQMHRVELEYEQSSGTATLKIDGVTEDTDTWALDGNQTISVIGHRPSNGTYSSALTADLEVEKEGVLVLDMPLDEKYTSELRSVDNKAAVLGDNISLSSAITSEHIGGDEITSYPMFEVEAGKSYLVSIEIKEYQGSGTCGVHGGHGVPASINSRVGDGKIEFPFTASATTTVQLFNRATNQCRFTNISCREIPASTPFGLFYNISDYDSTRHTKLRDNAWFGPNLITQDVWENPPSVGSEWTYAPSDNTWNLEGSGDLSVLSPLLGSAQPDVFYLAGEVEEVTGAGLAVFNAATAGDEITTAGTYSLIKPVSAGFSYKRFSGAVNAKIKKPQLRSYLELAHPTQGRHVTPMRAMSQSYIALATTVTLAGDFEIQLKFAWDDFNTSGEQCLLSQISPFSDFLMIKGSNNPTPNTLLYRSPASTDVTFHGVLHTDNKMNTLNLKRVGTDIILTLNGINYLRSEDSVTPFEIINIGCRGSDRAYFNGIIADVKIYDSGSLVLDMPIDQRYTPDSNQVIDKASGNNGTFHGVNLFSSYFVEENDAGDWTRSNDVVIDAPTTPATRRYFTPLDKVAGTHIKLTAPLTLPSDCRIRFKIMSAYDGARMVLGNTSTNNNCIFINDGRVHVRDETGSTLTSSDYPILENVMNSVEVVKTSGNVEVYVNGVLNMSGLLSTFVFDLIGTRQSNQFPFNGTIADVEVIDNGTLVLDMPIDGRYTTYGNVVYDHSGSGNHGTLVNASSDSILHTVRANGDWEGPNIIEGVTPFQYEGGWAQISAAQHVYTKSLTTQTDNLRFGSILTPRTTYEASMSVYGKDHAVAAGIRFYNVDIISARNPYNGPLLFEVYNNSNNNLNVEAQANYAAERVYINYVKPLIKVA